MFVIYRGLGLVWAILGAILAVALLVVTGSLSIALCGVAGFWIFVGRGRFELKALTDVDSEGKPRSPAVFFIPIWFYGAMVVPLALTAIGIELTHGRILSSSNLDAQHQAAANSGQQAFEVANDSIDSSRTGTAHGNTNYARTLAQAYSQVMKDITGQAFTGGKEGLVSLTNGNFVTYCHVNEQNSVVFLVHIPQLRQYKGEVRDTLAKLSWAAARQLLLESDTSDSMTLAVGLRGAILYGPIMVGSARAETVASTKGDRADLYTFFAQPTNPGDDVDDQHRIADARDAETSTPVAEPQIAADESPSDLPEEVLQVAV